jgi:hypothetical protein
LQQHQTMAKNISSTIMGHGTTKHGM